MAKATYVDGFVIPIPKKNAAEYRKMAKIGASAWKKFGALEYKECIIDDAKPKGVVAHFGKMAKVKPGEEVWLSFITFKSRAHRDQVNAKVMKYFDEKYKGQEMPNLFDMKRFAYGGFKVVVSG